MNFYNASQSLTIMLIKEVTRFILKPFVWIDLDKMQEIWSFTKQEKLN